MKVFLIVGGLVWLLATDHGPLGLLLAGMAGLFAWWVESRIWPEDDCWFWLCKGGIISWSPFAKRARRRCFVCGGSGRRQRTLAG